MFWGISQNHTHTYTRDLNGVLAWQGELAQAIADEISVDVTPQEQARLAGMRTVAPNRWPCCSGTFPHITADYGISSYFHDSDGVLVNLYVPSRLSWNQNGAKLSLTQRTIIRTRRTPSWS